MRNEIFGLKKNSHIVENIIQLFVKDVIDTLTLKN
jgi:hypothetical protein